MTAGRKPDFVVKVGLKGQKFHKRVGAGWKNDQGGVYVKLDPGLALVSGTDVVIALWPEDERPADQPRTASND